MEWQNESSLFTVRVRGRQWYWIYKFELRHMIDLGSAPKNIGHDRWVINMAGVHEVVDSYLYALRVRSQNVWLKRYWTDYVRLLAKNQSASPYALDFDNHELIPGALETLDSVSFYEDLTDDRFTTDLSVDVFYPYSPIQGKKGVTPFHVYETNAAWRSLPLRQYATRFKAFARKTFLFENKTKYDLADLVWSSFLISPMYRRTDEFIDHQGRKVFLFDGSRNIKKIVSEVQPIFVTKELLTSPRIRKFTEENYRCINVDFNKEKSVKKKVDSPQGFFVIKQKRYRLKQFIPVRLAYRKTESGAKTTDIRFSDAPYLRANSFIEHFEFEPTRAYRLLKKNRAQAEIMSTQLSRRLLRTRKTLVLPAHVNLTLITNSYDVVHSWFLPSLGVKLDCIPGRSTHHTFYVDSTGFFYGQCAEICGRYHHHMPIRLCMLPYEHFFVWWQHFGLPKVLGTYNKDKYEAGYGAKVFTW